MSETPKRLSYSIRKDLPLEALFGFGFSTVETGLVGALVLLISGAIQHPVDPSLVLKGGGIIDLLFGAVATGLTVAADRRMYRRRRAKAIS